MSALNEWKTKCVGLQWTWVSKRTVHFIWLYSGWYIITLLNPVWREPTQLVVNYEKTKRTGLHRSVVNIPYVQKILWRLTSFVETRGISKHNRAKPRPNCLIHMTGSIRLMWAVLSNCEWFFMKVVFTIGHECIQAHNVQGMINSLYYPTPWYGLQHHGNLCLW